jgi:hypothetical protein
MLQSVVQSQVVVSWAAAWVNAMAASPESSPREILTVERLMRGTRYGQRRISASNSTQRILWGSVYMSLELSPAASAIIRQNSRF